MPDHDAGRRLAAALQAQATANVPSPGRHAAPRGPEDAPAPLPLWLVWAGAALLGGVAGMLAALISAL